MAGAPPRCNQLAAPVEMAEVTVVRQPAPEPSRGVINDGLYHAESCRVYLAGGPAPMYPPVQMRIQVRGQSFEVVSVERGVLKDANVALTSLGKQLILRTMCGERSLDGANVPYSAQRTSFDLPIRGINSVWCHFVQ